MALVEAEFFDMRFDQRHSSPVVFLKALHGNKYLPIWIGELEASSIDLAVREKVLPRPVTHEFMCTLLDAASVTVISMCIERLENRTYYANLTIAVGGERKGIDCRPADAIALALRKHIPIYVEEQLLHSIGFLEGDGSVQRDIQDQSQ